METKRKVLVLGATGGIGGEVACQLRDAGWQVAALRRSLAAGAIEHVNGISWAGGDAQNPSDVAYAARGCTVIVHAVNPTGYRNWGELVLPMLENTITAAEREGATIVLPGTIYNYGSDAFPLLKEDSVQNPLTRKGAIRVAMESRLKAYAQRGGRVLIVRAGDFFGPKASNNWFSQGLIKPGRPVTQILNPGSPGIGHQWSYLPDVARAMVDLLEQRNRLSPFATFHMAGHWDHDGTQMAKAISQVVVRHGNREPKISAFPWWLVKLVSPFVVTFRELLEMRYLWQQPVQMDNAKLIATLSAEPLTRLEHFSVSQKHSLSF